MLETAAASGTLVASAMEAAGYHYQAYLLDSLTEPFTASLGSLFYVIAVITALINFAAFGQYKLTRWLIFGPVLFFAVLTARTESVTPRWKFAGVNQEEVNPAVADRYQSAVNSAIEDIEIQREGYANVSGMFAGYNNLISSVVQELTKVIAHVRQDERLNAKFLIRPQLHGDLTNSNSTDPLFNQLLHDGFFYQCSDALREALEVNQNLGGPQRRAEQENKLRAAMTQRVVKIQDNSMLYVAGLKADYGELWRGVSPGQNIDDAMKKVASPNTYQGTEREEAVQQAERDIRSDTTSRGRRGNTFTCGELWNIAYLGLHIEADRRIHEMERNSSNGLTADELREELLKVEGIRVAAGSNDVFSQSLALGQLRQVVARNMLNNHLQGASTLYPAFLSRLASAGDGVDGATTQGIRDLKDNYRHVRRADEWRKKSEAFSHAENLPYYQGVMLFFLAICFPFFSLLLLIPGRYAAFMHWFYLWMWVKSWDVGFAIVMSLDDILFDLLVSVHEKTSNATNVIFGAELDEALRSLEAIDPTFGPTIYYTIIGTAIASIPTITSQLVLGVAAAGSQMIAAGMALQADKIGDASGMVDTQNATMNERGGQADAIMSAAKDAQSMFKKGQGTPQMQNIFQGMSDPTKQDVSEIWGKAIDSVIGKTVDQMDGRMMASKFVGEGLKTFGNATKKTAKELLSAKVHGDDQEIKRLAFLTGLHSEAEKGSKIAQGFLSEIAKTAFEYRKAEISAVTNWAEMEAQNSPYALERASRAALSGALPLPWQVDMSAYDEQFALNMLSTYTQFSWLAKSSDMMGKMVAGGKGK